MKKLDQRMADFFIKNNVDQMVNRYRRFLVDSDNEDVTIVCILKEKNEGFFLEDKEIRSLFLKFIRPLIENANGEYSRDLLTDEQGNNYMYHVIPYRPQGYDVMVQVNKK